MKKLFFIAATVATLDVTNKYVWKLFPAEKQEYVYCVGTSLTFLGLYYGFFLSVKWIEDFMYADRWLSALKYLLFNFVWLALFDTYDEIAGDPYIISFWEYTPLFFTVPVTWWKLLKNTTRHRISTKVKKLISPYDSSKN